MNYSRESYIRQLQTGKSVHAGGMEVYETGRDNRLRWGIRHFSPDWGTSSEYYESLEECMDDFLALLEVKKNL